MHNVVDTRDFAQVEREVTSIYLQLFPAGEQTFVPKVLGWLEKCFSGAFPGYQAIDLQYHDFEHTLQGTLCLARLLRGRHLAGATPPVPQRMFELALLAILFHDTGYLKKEEDVQGTGAKYTAVHVSRSIEFAQAFLSQQGYNPSEILAIQNMIRCTGLNADVRAIPFASELERILGCTLTTADLLGQMAAADYVEKLPVLYLEFAEAISYTGAKSFPFGDYTSPEELMRQTPDFWQNYVLPRLNGEFGKLHQFLNEPYPGGPNYYLRKIEANMARLQEKLGK